jgi:hypothetical protein
MVTSSLHLFGAREELCQEFGRRPNSAAICCRMTRNIKEKPEIGLAAGGIGAEAAAETGDA